MQPTMSLPQQYLISKRVDLDAGDNFRVTPMHLAAIENHVDIVEALLEARVSVRSFDVEGDQALHWAATKGHDAVRALMDDVSGVTMLLNHNVALVLEECRVLGSLGMNPCVQVRGCVCTGRLASMLCLCVTSHPQPSASLGPGPHPAGYSLM